MSFEKALETLEKGGVVIYPTETCYGIGCDATDKKAVKKVYQAKRRPREKKLTCIIGSLEMAEKYCNLSKNERKLCEKFMPGPLTFIAEKKDKISDAVNTEFAFRVPGSKTSRRLSEELGKPIIATSANISGNPSRYSVENMSENLLEKVDFVLDQGKLNPTEPSTIAGFKGRKLKVFRGGPITREELEKFLEEIR